MTITQPQVTKENHGTFVGDAVTLWASITKEYSSGVEQGFSNLLREMEILTWNGGEPVQAYLAKKEALQALTEIATDVQLQERLPETLAILDLLVGVCRANKSNQQTARDLGLINILLDTEGRYIQHPDGTVVSFTSQI